MDFWYLPPDAERGRRESRTLERVKASNLSMTDMGAPAFLAPGPDGPVSTTRFEILREGLQECETRLIVESVLADDSMRSQLPEALVKRCRDMLDARGKVFRLVAAGGWGHYEGWVWFGSSGWEDRAVELFTCAGEVGRALKK
jgi:hypothetical protein